MTVLHRLGQVFIKTVTGKPCLENFCANPMYVFCRLRFFWFNTVIVFCSPKLGHVFPVTVFASLCFRHDFSMTVFISLRNFERTRWPFLSPQIRFVSILPSGSLLLIASFNCRLQGARSAQIHCYDGRQDLLHWLQNAGGFLFHCKLMRTSNNILLRQV